MDKKFIIILNRNWLLNSPQNQKPVFLKKQLPIGKSLSHLNDECEILLKFRNLKKEIILDNEAKLNYIKDHYCIHSDLLFNEKVITEQECNYFYLVIEGSSSSAKIIFYCDSDDDIIKQIDSEDPTLRLSAFDIPPNEEILIDTPSLIRAFSQELVKRDKELFSIHSDNFLKSPNIITSLFAHVMTIRSKDHIDYLSQLKCIADQIRSLIEDRIIKIEKNHKELWAQYYGEKISYADGGMSRIVGLPGTDPMAIRVGIYSVIPGESELEKREEWGLTPYIIGDLINDRSLLKEYLGEEPDTKRLLEAARYFVELFTVLEYIKNSKEKPKILFLHGPLVNSYETYNEGRPYYIPGFNCEFLEDRGISLDKICKEIINIPKNSDGEYIWNQPIAIYGYILKRIFQLETPVMGVIERSPSTRFTETLIDEVLNEGKITRSYKNKFLKIINNYNITDEFLFGCILEEGEFIKPVIIEKNLQRRAWDRWQPVISQYPQPYSSIIKTSSNKFPFKIEMNMPPQDIDLYSTFSLLYHTSRLLPNYAFPVGLDIVDKYSKIPDWLSKGVSSSLTAIVLSKALQTGNPKILMHVRQLLASSPRDFFFRPKIQ